MGDAFKVDKEFKLMYLETLKTGSTKNTYTKHLSKIDRWENELNRPIYLMKADEISMIIKNAYPRINSLTSIKSVINCYLKFINQLTPCKEAIQELKKISIQSIREITLEAEKKAYITKKEYIEILENEIGNAQDKIIIILLWNGIKGKNLNDILSLKEKDIDCEHRRIKIRNKTILLEEREIDIIEKAMKETVHHELDNNGKKYITRELRENDIYLIRGRYGSGKRSGYKGTYSMVPVSVLENRFKIYLSSLNKQLLTMQTVYNSGQIYEMLEHFNFNKVYHKDAIKYLQEKYEEVLANDNISKIQDIILEKIKSENNASLNKYDKRANDIGDSEDILGTEREDVQISRIIRDSKIVRELKKLHHDRCQICDCQLKFNDNICYSEGHHIRPLGKPHNGDDKKENIIIVCPNCHALCDYGAIKLESNQLNTISEHRIEEKYIEYYSKYLFKDTN